MKILDYIYYRLFMANYRYWGSSETARSISGLSLWLWFLQLPLLIWSEIMCKASNKVPVILYLLYGVFIIAFITIRYLNKGWYLKDTFSNCRADKLIPLWLFELIIIICSLSVLPATLYSKYIIDRYNLSGVGYDFFVNLFGN